MNRSISGMLQLRLLLFRIQNIKQTLIKNVRLIMMSSKQHLTYLPGICTKETDIYKYLHVKPKAEHYMNF